jgi:hypothetical protein
MSNTAIFTYNNYGNSARCNKAYYPLLRHFFTKYAPNQQNVTLQLSYNRKFHFLLSFKIIFQEIYTEIRHQSLLHLVSCFQIASKLEDGYKVENLMIYILNN